MAQGVLLPGCAPSQTHGEQCGVTPAPRARAELLPGMLSAAGHISGLVQTAAPPACVGLSVLPSGLSCQVLWVEVALELLSDLSGCSLLPLCGWRGQRLLRV